MAMVDPAVASFLENFVERDEMNVVVGDFGHFRHKVKMLAEQMLIAWEDNDSTALLEHVVRLKQMTLGEWWSTKSPLLEAPGDSGSGCSDRSGSAPATGASPGE